MPLLDISPLATSTSPWSSAATTVTPVTSTTTADTLLKLCLLWSMLNKPELQKISQDPDISDFPTPPLVCNEYLLLSAGSVSGSGGNPFPEVLNVSSNSTNSTSIPANEKGKLEMMLAARNQNRKLMKIDNHRYSSRSFAIIGALAGIVFILLIMALTTCIRHRRELYLTDDPLTSERSYAREVLMNHLRQFRSPSRNSNNNSSSNNAEQQHRRTVAPLDPPPSYEDAIKLSLQQQPSTSASISHLEVVVGGGHPADDLTCQPPSYLEAVSSSTSSSTEAIVVQEDSNVKQHDGVTTIQIN